MNNVSEVRFIRVNYLCDFGTRGSPARYVAVSSREQLVNYTQSYTNALGLESGYGDRFRLIMIKYDDVFFKDRALILLLLSENSGSISHTVDVSRDTDGLHIAVTRNVPQGLLTMDMASWLAVIEIDLAYAQDPIFLETI